MLVIALLILIVLAASVGFVIGVAVEADASRNRSCPHCHIRQQTVAAEMQLQRVTHAAMSQMLETARRAQRDELS